MENAFYSVWYTGSTIKVLANNNNNNTYEDLVVEL